MTTVEHDRSWYAFRGWDGQGDLSKLEGPPPWRAFSPGRSKRAPIAARKVAGTEDDPRSKRVFTQEELDLVNAALYLRRPLLVEGDPGTGKTSIAYAIARGLNLGPVLVWTINSRSTLKDGLYRYDAIGRLQEHEAAQRRNEQYGGDIGQFITLGPLGTALAPHEKPRVVLIDEFDKGDIDLPNDLLDVLERGAFEIPEVKRTTDGRTEVWPHDRRRKGKGLDPDDRIAIKDGSLACGEYPLVVITSNGERAFPQAFLRRCLRLTTTVPEDRADLQAIIDSHLTKPDREALDDHVHAFLARRKGDTKLATDQLLNRIFLAARARRNKANDADLTEILDGLLGGLGERPPSERA